MKKFVCGLAVFWLLGSTISAQEVEVFPQVGHSMGIDSMVFSPDGRQALSLARGTIKLWDIATGRETRTFSSHRINNQWVAFSPDGKMVLCPSVINYTNKREDFTYKLWEIETGREIGNFSSSSEIDNYFEYKRGNIYNYRQLLTASSPDGMYMLTAYDNGNIKLTETATGQEIRTFSGHSKHVSSVAFTPDGNQILSGSISYSRYSSGFNQILSLWDAATGRVIRTFLSMEENVKLLNSSPDGRQIIYLYDLEKTWDSKRGYYYYPKILRLYDLDTERYISTFPIDYFDGNINSIVFSPDGRQILMSQGGLNKRNQYDNILKIWDAATGRELRTFKEKSFIYSAIFSPDGKQVILVNAEGTIKLKDIITGRTVRTFRGNRAGHYFVKSAALSPDGRYLLSGGVEDMTIKLWDVSRGRVLRTFSGHSSYINTVIFSPDGRFALSGSWDNTIKLWDIATGLETITFLGHVNDVDSVSFSPDGKLVLSGSLDGTTRLWDAATGKEIAAFISFSGTDTQLLGSSRGTRDIAIETEEAASSIDGEWVVITPDGYYAASPRSDRYLNVRIGNTVTGIDSFRSVFYNPDVVRARLAGEPDPSSKANVTIQQAAMFVPPEVLLQVQARTTNSPNASISIAITDKNLPIQSIIVMNNGRRLGANELSAISGARGLRPNRASLAVTGNQQTLNLTLPVNLNPGDNRIEVVAFNGYSENRRFVDITWDAPAGNAPALPDLWILAIGVNKYDNAGAGLANMSNLNYCVADARGVIASLKAQEGKRYNKVHTLLVADDAEVKPTTANIRQSLRFLERAGDKDVVLLFLAGHGMSAQDGQFFFLPSDARVSANRTVDSRYAISGDEIVSVLDAPGNRLVFIDACHAGGVDNDRMIRKLMDTNAFVFASSRGNELSYELPELGHGVFTYSVIDALRGTATAARAAGNVSVISMSGFVSLDVPRRTDRRQHPSAYSLGFYDFTLAGVGE